MNRMDEYLLGVSLSLATASPSVLRAMADQFGDEICSGRHNTDLDLMLFARLALFRPEVGSARTLNCALETRKGEDVVLWELLRAWASADRPALPALSAIRNEAKDPRTRNLLLPAGEAQELVRKEAARIEAQRKPRQPPAVGGADTAPNTQQQQPMNPAAPHTGGQTSTTRSKEST